MYDDTDVRMDSSLQHNNYYSENRNPVFRMKDYFHNRINDDDVRSQDECAFDRNTSIQMDEDSYTMRNSDNLFEDIESTDVRQE